ncbi:MAG: diguanylate cyclase [Alphaproteobacteria bacterium]
MDSQRPTILVVDDQQINVRLLAETVNDLGKVIFAMDGATAIKMATEQQPDLILLDVKMPGIDGYAVCAQLKDRDDTRNIPIVFVSALGEEGEEEGLNAGAIDYIHKPFRPAIVKARVRNQLDLKRYRDALEDIAFHDGLTGLANRRAFDLHYSDEVRRAHRNKKPLTVVLCDIDHFKSYNDTYGHGKGDACLRIVGEALAAPRNRPGDMLARYGGEEFVGVFPECNITGAELICETLRMSVEQLEIPHKASSASDVVTISVGSVTAIPESPDIMKDLLEMADKQLYLSKQNGRNRVSCAEA